MTTTTNNLTGMSRTIDRILGEADTAPLRCYRCNGKARIESESFDNRGRMILRCMDCDFAGDLDVLKSFKKALAKSNRHHYQLARWSND